MGDTAPQTHSAEIAGNAEVEKGPSHPNSPEEPADNVPWVSVIVPIYNVERYLAQCLDSVLRQTLHNIEVICVNDGSTDGSLAIMRAYENADPRVRVLDGPNGGYGHAVNRGIEASHGDYIAVMEPDDFAEEHMYADLVAASKRPDGSHADIVKSSYWNYYDFEGEEPYIDTSNLMNCMPKRRFEFTVRTHWEVLYHHPSIWSAIYRRTFLEEKGIRMIEPKGAGWADNPFFFETLLQADSIVWLPTAYYHYRQTNPNASSNLRDFHLPFDRLRDIRSLLDRLGEHDPHVLTCLYNRTFSYIGTVIGRSGFPERDPEVFALIKEALASMDPGILASASKGIRREQLRYYQEVMGERERTIPEHAAAENVRLTVVVPLLNCRGLLWDSLESVAAQRLDDLEVICIDCGSNDRSREIVEAFAAKDKRFRLVDAPGSALDEARRQGARAARGSAVHFLSPGVALPQDALGKAAGAIDGGAGAVLMCGKAVYAHSGRQPVEGVRAELLATAADASSYVFSASALQTDAPAVHADNETGAILVLDALENANTVEVVEGVGIRDRRDGYVFGTSDEPDAAELHERHMALLDAMGLRAKSYGDDALRAWRCLAVAILLKDARASLYSDQCERVLEDIDTAFRCRLELAAQPPASFCNPDDYLSLCLMLGSPHTSVMRREAVRSRNVARSMRSKYASVKESGSYRLGNAIVRAGRKFIPRSVIAHMKG